MKREIVSVKTTGILGAVLGIVLALTIACSSAAIPTPAPQATAAPAATPTAVPTATTVAIPTSTTAPVPTAGPNKGGSLIIAGDVDIKTMDPTFSEDYDALLPMYGIFDGLVKLDANAQVVPDLAQSWDVSSDGTVLTFHLRQGVTFQDGEPFNAQAVKWTYDHYRGNDTSTINNPDTSLGNLRKSQLTNVVSVDVVDDYTIKMTLKQPDRSFLATIVERPGFILPPVDYAKDQTLFQSHPVGTGPYTSTTYSPGDRYVLTKNPNFWGTNQAYLDKITEYAVPDQSVKLAMVRSGEAQIANSMQTGDLALAEGNPNLKVSKNFGGRFEIIGITVDGPAPYNNEHFRKALGLALNREDIIKSFWQGQAQPAYSPIGPASGVWYDSSIQTLKYDPAQAKQELAAAGMANGVTFDFPCASDAVDIQHCEAIQSAWANTNLGIKANILPAVATSYWSDWVHGKDYMVQSWRAGRPDPQITIQRIYACAGFSNPAHYCNHDLDQLIAQAGATYDVAKAKALYTQIIETAQSDGHEIIESYPYTFIPMNKNLMGYNYYIDEIIRVRDLWLNQ